MLLGASRLIDPLRKAARTRWADRTLMAAQRIGQTTLRFYGGRIHQNFHEEDLTVWVKVALNGKMGVATTSSLRRESLLNAIRSAVGIAQLSGKHIAPAFSTSDSDRAPAENVETYFPETVRRPLAKIVETIRHLAKLCEKHGTDLAGSFVVGESELAVVGSEGLVRYQPFTVGALRLIATEGRSSGFAAYAFRDIRQLNPEALAERALTFCRMNRSPQPLRLGRYDVLLEPEAVAELMEWLSYIGFGAKQLAERTSFLTGRMGDEIMHPSLCILDDATHPEGLAMPFDFEGVYKKPVPLIQAGKASGVVYDSTYAKLFHTRSTGHAQPYDEYEGPMATHLVVAAGTTAKEDMLKQLGYGLWIRRFHYVNGLLNPHEALMTGLTRDGTFLVHNGKVVHAVKNLRFTQSILEAFSHVVALSKERERVADPAQGIFSVVTPAMLLKGFTFTGQTS
jgi:PmbA protein